MMQQESRDDCVICHTDLPLHEVGFVVCASHIKEAGTASPTAMFRWAQRLRDLETKQRRMPESE
jgi:hypothetical protein